jgi:UDP-N-acetylmuramate dehydrogenase
MSDKILKNINLKQFTTFGVDVNVSEFVVFSDVETLKSIVTSNKSPILILGGGSNMLFTKDFNGLILKNEINGIQEIGSNDNSVLLKVGAGENWHNFVMFTISNNYQGIENLSLIPGNVGASPIQNIGAYGVEVKDVIEKVEAFNLETLTIEEISNSACEFGYRDSIFKSKFPGKYVITSVYFRLNKSDKVNTSYGAINNQLEILGCKNPTIKDVSNAVIQIRESKLPNPSILGNAGSFFKNPVVNIKLAEQLKLSYPDSPSYKVDENNVKIPAGWLIETAGWKGKKVGNCGVHDKQALVLVNYGGATGKEVYELSEMIIEDVYQKFQIKLEREVNIF